MTNVKMRGQTMVVTQDLVTEICCNCGSLFAMTKEFQDRRVADKDWFYCPLGHAQRYSGPTDADKLRKQLDEERRLRQSAEQQVARWQDDYRDADARATRERNRANGYKGHATKITKRAKAGVCPCCNRSFENLRRHMTTKHPTFTPIEIDQVPQEASIQ